jgi:putative ABC transport system ATP-binding protein
VITAEAAGPESMPISGSPVFHGERLSRTYRAGAGELVAVRDASCRIDVFDRIAVTGPSGSGKSTLLHLISGLESPTSGSASWPALGGHPRQVLGRIGMVFQSPSLLPPLNVVENVALPLLLAGEPTATARARANAALAAVDLDGLADRLPEEISGGQGQRAAVARAIVGQPLVILADEPTGQLDTTTASHIIDVLLGAADRLGAALVVATHDPAIAGRLEQQWIMHDGVLSVPDTGHLADTERSLPC